VNKKIAKQIKETIHYDRENPSSRRNYRRAKKQYQKLSRDGKKDFLKLLNDFYNKKEQ
tara:strand:- start:607 stop:780 length:174 start_codon:yes stop_codon:yes gene_type:complete